MAKDTAEQLRNLGGPEHEATGALLGSVKESYGGAVVAADVLIAMANQIGKDMGRIDHNRYGGDRSHTLEAELRERIRAIHELAGRLGLSHALDIIVAQPLPGEGERLINPPQALAQDPEAVAIQLAVLTEVDNKSVSAVMMQYHQKPLTVNVGGPGIESALDDFNDI